MFITIKCHHCEKEYVTGSNSYRLKKQYICENCMAILQRKIKITLICMVGLMVSFFLGMLFPVGMLPLFHIAWMICSIIILKIFYSLDDEYNKVKWK